MFVTNSEKLLKLAQNIAVAEQSVFLLSHLQRGASILRKQHTITDLAVHRQQLSIVVHTAGTYGDHLCH